MSDSTYNQIPPELERQSTLDPQDAPQHENDQAPAFIDALNKETN